MNYEEATDWLLSRINYERASIPYHQRQLKLDRMRQLLVRLQNPDSAFPIVHVAGTKGKGSTSALLTSVLSAAGYRVGTFTSPHFESICERFAIDGVPCSTSTLASQVTKLKPVVNQMDAEAKQGEEWDCPTFFELCTAIGFSLFADADVDLAVVEVGLGGRLDSTNVCLPAVTVITSISFDHMRQLGNSLASIAAEKAGIIKPGVPVVTGVAASEPFQVIADRAREHGCRLIAAERDYRYTYRPAENPLGTDLCYEPLTESSERFDDVYIGLLGPHQAHNGAVAIATLLELRKQGWSIPTKTIRTGFRQATLPGRVEVFDGKPPVVVDTCHNNASAAALASTLELTFPEVRRLLVVSISRDKDVRAILSSLVPQFDLIIATEFQENPRAVDATALAKLIGQITSTNHLPEVTAIADPVDAYNYALAQCRDGELICIAGSFFLAAELRGLVASRNA